jgi:hypothetical protein
MKKLQDRLGSGRRPPWLRGRIYMQHVQLLWRLERRLVVVTASQLD